MTQGEQNNESFRLSIAALQDIARTFGPFNITYGRTRQLWRIRGLGVRAQNRDFVAAVREFGIMVIKAHNAKQNK